MKKKTTKQKKPPGVVRMPEELGEEFEALRERKPGRAKEEQLDKLISRLPAESFELEPKVNEPLLTYEVIAETAPKVLLRMVKSGMFDAGSRRRIAHWWRFMQRVVDAVPRPNLKIRDAISDDELQEMWQETADPGDDVGKCPLLH